MRYCLPCRAEYAHDPERCPDCGSRTLTPEERDAWYRARDELTQEEFVEVHVFDGPVDRAIITEMLTEEGVPWVVHGAHADPLGAVWRVQRGWGVLLVPGDDAARAREIVRRYEESVVVED